MTTPYTAAQPSIDPAQIIAGNARLHDNWQLRYAVVTDVTGPTQGVGRYDGDTRNTVPLISLVGPLQTGQRVSVIFIPPSGNYVVGTGRNGFASYSVASIGPNPAEGNATTVFAPMTNLNIPFTKYFSDTKVKVDLSGSAYAGTINAGGEFAVQFDTDYTLALQFFNIASTHLGWSGNVDVPNLPAGSYSVDVRFRRYTGAGSIVWDFNDYVTCRLQESP